MPDPPAQNAPPKKADPRMALAKTVELNASKQESPTRTPPAEVPLGKRVLRVVFFVLGTLFLLAILYRWAGTNTMRGTVQRVYEETASYRVEFVDAEGEVHVLENEPIRFPHFKTEVADVQAELHRFARTGDIVDITTWGFRASLLSLFPNVVDTEFVRSTQDRAEEQVERLTKHVLDELVDQGIVERGPTAERMRPGLRRAIQKSIAAPSSPEAERH